MTKQTAVVNNASTGDETVQTERARHVLAASTPHAGWRLLAPLIEQAGGRVASDDTVQRWLGSTAASGNARQQAVRGIAQELERSEPGATVLLPVGSTVNEQLLGDWTAAFDDTLMVLFHTRPETALARAMEEGSDPTTALGEWQTAAHHLLHVHRHNRRRSRVIDVERARSAPAEFAQACKEYLGLEPKQPRAQAEIGSEQTNADPIYSLIAAQMVAQTPEVQSLAGELEASSLPMGSPAGPAAVDFQAVYQRFLELKDHGEYKELQQENEGLLAQLHQVQEELESYCLQWREEEKARQEYEKKLKERDEREQEQHKELQEENELLLVQLHQVQEELESYYLQCREEEKTRQQCEKKIDEREKKVKELQRSVAHHKKNAAKHEKKISNIRRSLSWKLTMPLRVFKRLITGQPLRGTKKG